MVSRDSNFASPLFLLIIITSSVLAEIGWSVCMSKSKMSLCMSFIKTDAGLCIYHLFVWSNFNFLHHAQWITLLILSCLVLYSFCANLMHSLIIIIIIIIIIIYPIEFFTSVLADGFSLEFEWQQVSSSLQQSSQYSVRS